MTHTHTHTHTHRHNYVMFPTHEHTYTFTTCIPLCSDSMSLNDVCVYVPAWFGVSATVFVGLLASECSNSWSVGAAAAVIMSIIPAHIMRSVGGGWRVARGG